MRAFGMILLVWSMLGGHLESARAAATPDGNHPQIDFPKPLDEYHDDDTPNLGQKLIGRKKWERD